MLHPALPAMARASALRRLDYSYPMSKKVSRATLSRLQSFRESIEDPLGVLVMGCVSFW